MGIEWRSAQSPRHRNSRAVLDGPETWGNPLSPLCRRDGHALRPAGPRRGDHLPRTGDLRQGRADAGQYAEKSSPRKYRAGDHRPTGIPRVAHEFRGQHRVRAGRNSEHGNHTRPARPDDRRDRASRRFFADADGDRGRVLLLARTWPARNHHGAGSRLLRRGRQELAVLALHRRAAEPRPSTARHAVPRPIGQFPLKHSDHRRAGSHGAASLGHLPRRRGGASVGNQDRPGATQRVVGCRGQGTVQRLLRRYYLRASRRRRHHGVRGEPDGVGAAAQLLRQDTDAALADGNPADRAVLPRHPRFVLDAEQGGRLFAPQDSRSDPSRN